MANTPNILLVDDLLDIRLNVRIALAREGLTAVDEATDNKSLFSTLQKNSYDIIILDLEFPNSRNEQTFTAGFESLERLQKDYPEIPVIVFSESYEHFLIREVFKRGAFEYIGKSQPDSQKKLIRSVQSAWGERKSRLTRLINSPLNKDPKATPTVSQDRIQERDSQRILRNIEHEYKLLEMSEEKSRRIREKWVIETDPSEKIKLEKQERQEQQIIDEIEAKIAELKAKFETLSGESSG